MRNPLLRGCIDDYGVKSFFAAPQKRCTIVHVAGDVRWERKIASREGDRLRIDIDDGNGSAILASMVPAFDRADS
jgi:hypothetical protein